MAKEKRVKCADCTYADVDKNAPGNVPVWFVDRVTGKRRRVIWTGIECKNPDSQYYLALLNIDRNGNRQHKVMWYGCEHGRRAENES